MCICVFKLMNGWVRGRNINLDHGNQAELNNLMDNIIKLLSNSSMWQKNLSASRHFLSETNNFCIYTYPFWSLVSVIQTVMDGWWLIQCVSLATKPGISLIILPLMRILQRNLSGLTSLCKKCDDIITWAGSGHHLHPDRTEPGAHIFVKTTV